MRADRRSRSLRITGNYHERLLEEQRTGKQSQKSLGSTVNDIYLMQGDGVNGLFPNLEFSLGALNEFSLSIEEHSTVGVAE